MGEPTKLGDSIGVNWSDSTTKKSETEASGKVTSRGHDYNKVEKENIPGRVNAAGAKSLKPSTTARDELRKKLGERKVKKEAEIKKQHEIKKLKGQWESATKKLELTESTLELVEENKQLEEFIPNAKADLNKEFLKAKLDVRIAKKEVELAKAAYEKALKASDGPKSILKKTGEPKIKESKISPDKESYLDKSIEQAEENATMNRDDVSNELREIHAGRQELRYTQSERREKKESLTAELKQLKEELSEYEASLAASKPGTQHYNQIKNDIEGIKQEISGVENQIHEVDTQRHAHLQKVNESWKKDVSQTPAKKSGAKKKGIRFNEEVARNIDGKISTEKLDGAPKPISEKPPKIEN